MNRKTIGLIDYTVALMMIAVCMYLVMQMFSNDIEKSVIAFVIHMLLAHLISMEIKEANLAEIDYSNWKLRQNFLSEINFMILMTLVMCTLTYKISNVMKTNIDKVFILSIIATLNILVTIKLVKHQRSLNEIEQEN